MFCGVFGYFQLTTTCSQPVTFCHGFKRLQFVTGSNPSVVRFYRTTTTIFKQFTSTFPWVFQQKYPFFHDFLSKKMPLFHDFFANFCRFSTKKTPQFPAVLYTQSGKADSNRRPQRPERCALPTALLPVFITSPEHGTPGGSSRRPRRRFRS